LGSAVLPARGPGASGRGLRGITSSVGTAAIGVAGFGLPFAVADYARRRREGRTGELVGNNLAYAGVLALVFVPAFWLFLGQIADIFARGRGGLERVLAAVMIPLSFLNWTLNNQLVGLLKFFAWNALSVL